MFNTCTEFFPRVQELASTNFQGLRAQAFAALVYLALVYMLLIGARRLGAMVQITGLRAG